MGTGSKNQISITKVQSCGVGQRKTDTSTMYNRYIIAIHVPLAALLAARTYLGPAAFHQVFWNWIYLVFHLNFLLPISHYFN